MKILYICTHNRCRSILSEAITNQFAQGNLVAKSAGSQPAGEVHPLTLTYLKEAGISTENLRSQSWDDFVDFAPDVVITVCDSAAGESCPLWFGNSVKVHWGLADPSRLANEGATNADVAHAFQHCITEIKQRVAALSDLAHITEPSALRSELAKIGAQ